MFVTPDVPRVAAVFELIEPRTLGDQGHTPEAPEQDRHNPERDLQRAGFLLSDRDRGEPGNRVGDEIALAVLADDRGVLDGLGAPGTGLHGLTLSFVTGGARIDFDFQSYTVTRYGRTVRVSLPTAHTRNWGR
jgi:hypothetical protein